MADGRVILAHLYFVAFSALLPGLIFQHWIAYAIGGALAITWWIVSAIIGTQLLLKTLPLETLNVAKYLEIGKLVNMRRCGPGIGPPHMWLLNDMSPMILAIGLTRRNSHLIFTKGFFDQLDDKSQIGLTIRQIEAIRRGNTSANTGLAVLLYAILLPGRLASKLAGAGPGEPNLWAMILNLIPAFFVGMPCSLLGADKNAVHRVDTQTLPKLDNPDYLPYGLMKLQEIILASSFNVDLALVGCCIINPHSRDPYQAIIKVHPPTPRRIDRLRIRADAERKKFERKKPVVE
jgi:Zn-dependent protease with chaperone function